MQLMSRPAGRIASRFAYGAVVYWGLNIALVLAEMRWHLLARLTVWDIRQLAELAKLLHH